MCVACGVWSTKQYGRHTGGDPRPEGYGSGLWSCNVLGTYIVHQCMRRRELWTVLMGRYVLVLCPRAASVTILRCCTGTCRWYNGDVVLEVDWYEYGASMYKRRWLIDMVHGEISAFSAPGLSRSRFLGAALEPAGGTTGCCTGGLRVPQRVWRPGVAW